MDDCICEDDEVNPKCPEHGDDIPYHKKKERDRLRDFDDDDDHPDFRHQKGWVT